MKKIIKDLRPKNLKELDKEIAKVKEEMTKLTIEQRVSPTKDTNQVYKMRRRLAVMLTLAQEKRELDKAKQV